MANNTISKKLVPISDNTLNDVMKASIKEDVSTNKFVEEALKHAVHMNSLGISSSQLLRICEVIRAFRVLGGSFVPMEVLDYLTHKAYADDKETVETKWCESGVWYGKFIKEKFSDPLEGLKEFLLATRWELSEVDVLRHNGAVKLRCISSVLSREETELLVKFIDGVMRGMGYHANGLDCVKGIIALEYKH